MLLDTTCARHGVRLVVCCKKSAGRVSVLDPAVNQGIQQRLAGVCSHKQTAEQNTPPSAMVSRSEDITGQPALSYMISDDASCCPLMCCLDLVVQAPSRHHVNQKCRHASPVAKAPSTNAKKKSHVSLHCLLFLGSLPYLPRSSPRSDASIDETAQGASRRDPWCAAVDGPLAYECRHGKKKEQGRQKRKRYPLPIGLREVSPVSFVSSLRVSAPEECEGILARRKKCLTPPFVESFWKLSFCVGDMAKINIPQRGCEWQGDEHVQKQVRGGSIYELCWTCTETWIGACFMSLMRPSGRHTVKRLDRPRVQATVSRHEILEVGGKTSR